MKLYLLRPIKKWEPWYDKCFGSVIRAKSEDQARKLASNRLNSGDEGGKSWLDKSLTSCVELPVDGSQEVIISDFHWA